MSSLPKPYFTPEEYLERERLADYKSEHFVKQTDGSWRMTEANGEETILLSSLGCVLPLADVYNKVSLEPPVRLVLDEPR